MPAASSETSAAEKPKRDAAEITNSASSKTVQIGRRRSHLFSIRRVYRAPGARRFDTWRRGVFGFTRRNAPARQISPKACVSFRPEGVRVIKGREPRKDPCWPHVFP